MDTSQNHPESSLYRRLPYLIAGLVFIASIFLWHCLEYKLYFSNLDQSILNILPWLVLLAGSLLAILIGISIHYVQLTRLGFKSLNLMGEDVKKEMSERMLAEESKQKLEKTLLQGQKLQAIGTLAGGIAHDFNNILYAIIGYVEMAREDVEQDSIVHKNLGKVLEASGRGQDLIARILAFSRRQHQDFKPVKLQAAIESALALLRPTVPASVTIHFDSTPDDCTILGNQTQLHQIMLNIINNAVDAMDSEGTVTIKLTRVLAHDDLLKQIPEAGDHNYCKIDISDTGYGMDQSTMSRIFEPFYTTKEVGKGTGLGLATVHTIAKAHKGEILVSSQLGRGTTFTLLLPEFIEENTHGENSIS